MQKQDSGNLLQNYTCSEEEHFIKLYVFFFCTFADIASKVAVCSKTSIPRADVDEHCTQIDGCLDLILHLQI